VILTRKAGPEQEASRQREAVKTAAALWVVRLAEPGAASALRAEFEAWRAQGPEFDLYYQRELRAWDGADGIGRPYLREAGRRREPLALVDIVLRSVLAVVIAGLVGFVVLGAWSIQYAWIHRPPAILSHR
jgi:ferric-dicitrate binding protein FerR (iron transport regulator)